MTTGNGITEGGATTGMSPPAPEALTLTAADGFRLAATRYPAADGTRGRILIASATGVPQGFYRRFAVFARTHGFEAITLDYRGVGGSAPERLAGFDMDFLDWGRLDLAAAVDAVPADRLPLYLVGHSYGAHALGLLPSHERITAAAFCACGAGWHGWMPWHERIRVRVLWNVLGPLLTRWKGYLPFSLLGLGEDLPLPVYRQWRRWCRNPHYFFDEPELADQLTGFAAVRCPIAAVNATDDGWAPPASRDAFMRGYTSAPWQAVDLEPAVIGTRSVGHMGYFRSHATPLWQSLLDWLADPTQPFRLTA